MLEVPEQIEAVLAKALRHLSKLYAHIRCETTVAISRLAMRRCAAARIMAVAHTLQPCRRKTHIYQQTSGYGTHSKAYKTGSVC